MFGPCEAPVPQETAALSSTLSTPLLDQIASPEDLRRLPQSDLRQVADELRADLIDAVSRTGGHLGAGLGVVELTVAIHAVFDTPRDRLIWDVGHQAYPHKILTGRREAMRTVRQEGGLSGFAKRTESEYDPFGAGHSSTSISAGLGMAVASEMDGRRNNVIAVIGDGAMSAGMAYEAMNNAGALDARLVVILNDNDMSIAPPTGAMSAYLARLVSGKAYRSLRERAKAMTRHLPEFMREGARRTEEYTRGLLTGGTLFEELGFFYVGPIDGHDLDHLLPVLRNVRDTNNGPVLIHVVTKKGKGYPPAEASADKYHGVSKVRRRDRGAIQAQGQCADLHENLRRKPRSGSARGREDRRDPCGHAGWDGLDLFGQAFPKRTFDVGIAEQHAVTFAAGLATEGYKPFVAVYSTFLQRAYDQIVHDVAIQHLPVRFAIDRAGFVGADGPTHAGSFDTGFLCPLPGMVVMAAADEAELRHMVRTAVAYEDGPISFRYPRGNGTGVDLPERGSVLALGKGRILKEGTKVAILSFGSRLTEALAAAEDLEGFGLSTTVADARFAKPLDGELIAQLARHHEVLILLEEGASGGFAAQVLEHLARNGLLDHGLKVRPLTMPDLFVDHASPEAMVKASGLDRAGIVDAVFRALGTGARRVLQA